MKKSTINEEQALILQTIEEYGEGDIESLVETLRYDRWRMLNILQNLQRKGLVKLKMTGYGAHAKLSRKGLKAMRLVWPQASHGRYS